MVFSRMASKYQEGCKQFRMLLEGCYDESTHGKVDLSLKHFIGGGDISNPGQDAPHDTRGLAMWFVDSVLFLKSEAKLFKDDIADIHADVEDGEGDHADRFVVAGDKHWPLFHRFCSGAAIAATVPDFSDVDDLFHALAQAKQKTDELTLESFNAMTFANAKQFVVGAVKHFNNGAELKMAKHYVSSGMPICIDASLLRQLCPDAPYRIVSNLGATFRTSLGVLMQCIASC